MTLPVSTSGSGRSFARLSTYGVAVPVRVVGNLVDPAAPDDADPGAGQDAYGVGMVVAAGAGVGVDLRGPGAAWRLLSANVVIATRKRLLQAQRKCTARCLPDSLVTGVTPASAAMASGPS